MKYKTSLGKQKVVRVNHPRANLTVQNLNDCGTRFVNISPFDATIGSLTSFFGAERVTETTEKLI